MLASEQQLIKILVTISFPQARVLCEEFTLQYSSLQSQDYWQPERKCVHFWTSHISHTFTVKKLDSTKQDVPGRTARLFSVSLETLAATTN
jgi:hypothetical protein